LNDWGDAGDFPGTAYRRRWLYFFANSSTGSGAKIVRILNLFIFCAAAVSALAKFGAQCEELLPSVLVLLERSQFDTDDEVRDRATFFFNVLNEKQKGLSLAYIINGK